MPNPPRRIAIHQPNFAPWCGYFAKAAVCDTFIFLDDVQMSKNSYTNRCQIVSGNDKKWLTVPVRFSLGDAIQTVEIADPLWGKKHWDRLAASYKSAAHFSEIRDLLAGVFLQNSWTRLAPLNIALIRTIANYLALGTQFVSSSAISHSGTGDDRLISIMKALGGATYVSGKGGQNYQDPAKFAGAGIALEVREYAPRPYPQFDPAFMPGLSIMDALFHLGKGAAALLRYGP